MRYGSVCSGIEAASVAWHSLGWKPVFFAEIEKFPSAVLAHRFPHVPNLGDFTKIEAKDVGPIDLLVGGTPCQSFSLSGKRLGLDDPRGNLALEFCRLARRLRPRWLVWENVPGVHSSWSGSPQGEDLPYPADGGSAEWRGDEDSDFGAFLDALEECGYSACWRILDSQYVRVDTHARAVPQRRERVFLVGYLGDWRPPAAVLLEPEGLRGDTPPRREAREGVAHGVTTRSGNGSRRGDGNGNLVTGIDLTNAAVSGSIAGTLEHAQHKSNRGLAVAFGGNNTSGPIEIATALNAKGGAGRMDFETETLVAHSLRGGGFDASEDGTGRGTPIIPVQEVTKRTGASSTSLKAGDGIGEVGDPMFTLGADSRHGVAIGSKHRSHWNGGPHPPLTQASQTRQGGIGGSNQEIFEQGGAGLVPHPIAFSCKDHGNDAQEGVAPTMRSMNFDKSHANAGGQLAIAFDTTQITSKENRCQPKEGDPCHPLSAHAHAPALAFHARQDPDSGPVTHPLDTDGFSIGVQQAWAVRRLTPLECERLQAFPDGWTQIPYRGKPAADGPRYKAIGNSFSTNVVRWIGHRIQMAEEIING